jgi:hypothetical protein
MFSQRFCLGRITSDPQPLTSAENFTPTEDQSMDERMAYIGGKLYSNILVCLKDERRRKLVVKLKCEENQGETTKILFEKSFEIGELNSQIAPKNKFIILPFSIDIPNDFVQSFDYEKNERENIFVTNYISLEADELRWPPGSPMPVTLVNIFKPAPELPVFKVHTEQVKCGIMQTRARHYRITFNKDTFAFGEPI